MIELPEADRELLEGVCDLHIHASPDIPQRAFTELELARQMREVGYKAVLFKSHYAVNADRAQIVSKVVPGISVFGGIVLNHTVGGINPLAVEAALGFGAKQVWMPTLHAANHIKKIGVPGYPRHTLVKSANRPRLHVEGISILDSSGELIPQVHEVLSLVADANVALGTCHISLEEVMALVKAARDQGVKKILVTHPGWEATDWPLDSLEKLVEMGAILEYCYVACMPYGCRLDPKRLVEGIRRVGPQNCVMSTDFGQPYNPHPIDGMRQYIKVLQALGITNAEIDLMARRNPARLLSLE